jgi:hypothetical protein
MGVDRGRDFLVERMSSGKTTQVPARRVIAVEKHVRRKIGYKETFLSFERG